jgi:hypothetical protein
MTTIKSYIPGYGNVMVYFPAAGQLQLHIAPSTVTLPTGGCPEYPPALAPALAQVPLKAISSSYSGGALIPPGDRYFEHPPALAPALAQVPLKAISSMYSGGALIPLGDGYFEHPPALALAQVPLEASICSSGGPLTMPADWHLDYPPSRVPKVRRELLDIPLDWLQVTRRVPSLASPCAIDWVFNFENDVDRGNDCLGGRNKSRYNTSDGEFTP